jgi:hypothetical protein
MLITIYMMIIIIGNGIAGRARVKIYKKHSDGNILHLSRRVDRVFDASIYPTDVSRVHVCTENSSHFELIQFLLSKIQTHVCVEFPLANTLSECEELFELANRNQLVLHCSFISLLTEHHLVLKNYVATHFNQLRTVTIDFQGGMNSWLLAEHHKKNWGVLATSRIMSLFDLFGELQIENVIVEPKKESYSLKIAFSKGNLSIVLHESRSPDLKRSKKWYFNGSEVERVPQIQSLFEMDNIIFNRLIEGTGTSYVPKERVLYVAGLVEEIQRRINKY